MPVSAIAGEVMSLGTTQNQWRRSEGEPKLSESEDRGQMQLSKEEANLIAQKGEYVQATATVKGLIEGQIYRVLVAEPIHRALAPKGRYTLIDKHGQIYIIDFGEFFFEKLTDLPNGPLP